MSTQQKFEKTIDQITGVLSVVRFVVLGGLMLYVFNMFVSPAWSMETTDLSAVATEVRETAQAYTETKNDTFSAGDSCKAYLSASYTNKSTAHDADRVYGEAEAQKAAALGLVFGIKFALVPQGVKASPKDRTQFYVGQPSRVGNREASAIIAYRECKNNQALHAISDWRWSR